MRFLSVVKMTSILTVLSIAANMDLEVKQLDAKMAFVHGELEEEIYMQQIEGKGNGEPSMSVEKEPLRIEAGSLAMVSEV